MTATQPSALDIYISRHKIFEYKKTPFKGIYARRWKKNTIFRRWLVTPLTNYIKLLIEVILK